MKNFSNQVSLGKTYEEVVLPLVERIKARGGYVDEEFMWKPDELRNMMKAHQCPWIAHYFGSQFHDWDEVLEYARSLVGRKTAGLDLTDAMRALIGNLTRHSTPHLLPIHQNLPDDLSTVGRFLKSMQIAIEHESNVYNSTTSDSLGLAHYLDYCYKFSHLSYYNPSVYKMSLNGYSETRPINLDSHDLDVLADWFVWYQTQFGVLDRLHSLTPKPLDECQIVALEHNPTSAYSLPTMMNAKDKAAREENLALAEELKRDPWSFGLIPFMENRRIQQGGNIVNRLLVELYPSFDPKAEWPTLSQLESAVLHAWETRPPILRYVKTLPSDYTGKYMSSERLPTTLEEREALVDSGMHDACILKQRKDKSFVFDFLLKEPNIWVTVGDKYPDDPGVSPEELFNVFSKNRVVFAAPGPVTLNSQAYLQLVKDIVRDEAESRGSEHLVAQWRPPEKVLKCMTNLWAAVSGQPNVNGKEVRSELTDSQRAMCSSLTGDDKSSFDNFQSLFWHTLFNFGIVSPMFKSEYKDLWKYLSMYSIIPQIMTFDGLYQFSEAMPSGHGTTNDQDTMISSGNGVLDQCNRIKCSFSELTALWSLIDTGQLAQGDDYESHDVAEPNGEEKEANAAKTGLVLSAPKSLMSPNSMEFTRKFSNGYYRFDYKEEDMNILCLHHPFMHMMCKWNFSEDAVKNPPAINSIAGISRANNILFHPNFVNLLPELIQLDKLSLGCKPTDYVPDWLVDEWREAGEPPAPSPYHVRITNPIELYNIAGQEAAKKHDTLDHIVSGWRSYDGSDVDFEDQLIVKVLMAVSRGDQGFIDAFKGRVTTV